MTAFTDFLVYMGPGLLHFFIAVGAISFVAAMFTLATKTS